MHQHAMLASELKQLYVMCTRPRRMLLFFDKEAPNANPMLEFWLKQGLVQHKSLDQDIIDALRVGRCRGIHLVMIQVCTHQVYVCNPTLLNLCLT